MPLKACGARFNNLFVLWCIKKEKKFFGIRTLTAPASLCYNAARVEENPTNQGFKMAYETHDFLFQKWLPPRFQFLGEQQLKTTTGKSFGEPKFIAVDREGSFNKGQPFYTKDQQILMGLCWKVVHNRLVQIPNDYLKNGCGSYE